VCAECNEALRPAEDLETFPSFAPRRRALVIVDFRLTPAFFSASV